MENGSLAQPDGAEIEKAALAEAEQGLIAAALRCADVQRAEVQDIAPRRAVRSEAQLAEVHQRPRGVILVRVLHPELSGGLDGAAVEQQRALAAAPDPGVYAAAVYERGAIHLYLRAGCGREARTLAHHERPLKSERLAQRYAALDNDCERPGVAARGLEIVEGGDGRRFAAGEPHIAHLDGAPVLSTPFADVLQKAAGEQVHGGVQRAAVHRHRRAAGGDDRAVVRQLAGRPQHAAFAQYKRPRHDETRALAYQQWLVQLRNRPGEPNVRAGAFEYHRRDGAVREGEGKLRIAAHRDGVLKQLVAFEACQLLRLSDSCFVLPGYQERQRGNKGKHAQQSRYPAGHTPLCGRRFCVCHAFHIPRVNSPARGCVLGAV